MGKEYKLNISTYIILISFVFVLLQMPIGGLLVIPLLLFQHESTFVILVVFALFLFCFLFGLYLLKIFIDILKSNCSSIVVYNNSIDLEHRIKGKIELFSNEIKNIEIKAGTIIAARRGGRLRLGKIKIETINNEIYTLYISDYYDFYFMLPSKMKVKLNDTPIFGIEK